MYLMFIQVCLREWPPAYGSTLAALQKLLGNGATVFETFTLENQILLA